MTTEAEATPPVTQGEAVATPPVPQIDEELLGFFRTFRDGFLEVLTRTQAQLQTAHQELGRLGERVAQLEASNSTLE